MCLFFYLQNKNRAFFMTNLDIVNFGAKLPYVHCILIGKTSWSLYRRFP